MTCYSQPRRLLKLSLGGSFGAGSALPPIRGNVAVDRTHAVRLAHALRDLRESKWPDVRLTQAPLANALSAEGSVAPATLSSWESTNATKTPAIARMSGYARFFATRRSLDPEPHLIPENELDADELERFRTSRRNCSICCPLTTQASHTFQFETGPVVVICPTVPVHLRGPLATSRTELQQLQQYGDLDALIELYGHLRAENPTLDVFHRSPPRWLATTCPAMLSCSAASGGTSSPVGSRCPRSGPVTQIDVNDLDGGDVFMISDPEGERTLDPSSEGEPTKVLVADVGYLARLRNPFKLNRTLTICNGIFTRAYTARCDA